MAKDKCGKQYVKKYINGRPVWAICTKRSGHLWGGCKNGG